MRRPVDDFKRYLFEVLAIITAITLSFLFDEWRDNRRDRRDSRDLLASIHENLKRDTFILSKTIDFQKKIMAGEEHLLNHGDSSHPDSLVLGMVAFQSYPSFRKTDVSYLTMIQTGQSRVIANKKLLNQITDVYQNQYKIIADWEEIDRQFVLEKTIPYANSNIPFVTGFNYGSLLSSPQFRATLKKDEFRNLLNTDYTFKKMLNILYTSTQKSVDSLIKKVDAEVKNLQ